MFISSFYVKIWFFEFINRSTGREFKKKNRFRLDTQYVGSGREDILGKLHYMHRNQGNWIKYTQTRNLWIFHIRIRRLIDSVSDSNLKSRVTGLILGLRLWLFFSFLIKRNKLFFNYFQIWVLSSSLLSNMHRDCMGKASTI